MEDRMRITRLTVSNFMRLSAVEVIPDPDKSTVVISGKNGAGKTAVLNSIAIALGGAKAVSLLKPIKDGEENAEVVIETDDLVITRRWTKSGPGTLTITDSSGRSYKRPQEFLYSLIDNRSFDLLAFANATQKDLSKMLLDVVDMGIDLDKNAEDRQSAYDKRTNVNRKGKEKCAALRTATAAEALPNDLPTEETPATEALMKYQIALAAKGAQETQLNSIAVSHATIARLQKEKEVEEADIARLHILVDAFEEQDIDALKATADSVEETNRQVREAQRRAEMKAEANALDKESKGLTLDIESLDKDKADALAAAKMPAEGLSFGDEGVTYQGLPFEQECLSMRLRLSIAVAMAKDPKLRVLTVSDASLLDAENMAVIEEMAKEHDFQIWLEVVADASGDVGVVIEEGAVKTNG